MTGECPYCEEDIEIPADEIWGGEFDCPKCGKLIDVESDYIGEDSHYTALLRHPTV